MTTEENKKTYRRFLEEGFNRGNLSVLDEVLAPTYVYHDAPPGSPTGADGIKQIISAFRTAFPDLEIVIEDQVAEDDKVSSRTVMHGTHKGPLFGIPPTNKPVAMTGLTMVRLANGKITDSWVKNDVPGLFQQLGVKPPGS